MTFGSIVRDTPAAIQAFLESFTMPNFRRRQPRHFESLEQRNLLSGTPSLLLDVHRGRASSWPTEFVDVDGTTFFAAADRAGTGKGLWKSDGTEAGTEGTYNPIG